MSGVRFVRRVDGLTYEFVRDGDAHGFPSYRRVDLDIWCRRLPSFGWVVCDAADLVSSRPFDEPGQGELPPEGAWVSNRFRDSVGRLWFSASRRGRRSVVGPSRLAARD